MTLDETWELCLQMWKWIAEEWEPGESVDKLKTEWLERHGHTISWEDNNCFFCQYANARDECYVSCPGLLVDDEFSCVASKHCFDRKPKEFYVELVRLNTIRLEKNMAELKCADGTVVQISASTEAELRKAFGPKLEPERTYRIGDVFYRSHKGGEYLQLRIDNEDSVALCQPGTQDQIYFWHDVYDLDAITMAEVRQMTAWPNGLRCVERFTITE